MKRIDVPAVRLPPLHTAQQLTPVWVDEAKRGDHTAGFKLIHLIFSELKKGQLSENMRFYLLDAMRQIADGEDANAVLHLKRPKSRPQEPERLMEIAIKVERIIQSGESKEKAMDTVARELGRTDTSNIGKAHTSYKTAAKAAIAMENLERVGQ